MAQPKTNVPPVVTKDWLVSALNSKSPQIKLLDCTWFMPAANRSPATEFLSARLKGANYFGIDDVCDKSSPLPHMTPTAKQFEDQVSALGISNDDHVVCYDTNGFMAAARSWWLFRLFGHENVSCLDKGFNKDLYSDVPQLIEQGPLQNIQPTVYHAKFNRNLLTTLNDIKERNKDAQIVDARPPDRFHARVPEPRPGMQGGHIPGAFSTPSSFIVQDGSLAEADKIKEVFSKVDFERPIITSCGSGVTAAILSLGLASIGVPSSLYDGSWSEYGQNSLNLPVEK